ncbi:MAG: acetate kinase, partial [Endomicrobia bacterium]|nr:acetate kinase [Endomicrobiia bacterium]
MKDKRYAVMLDCGRNFIEFGFYVIDTEEELIRGRVHPIGATISEVKYTIRGKQTLKDFYSAENISAGVKLVQSIIIQNFGKDVLQSIICCVHRVVHGGDKYFSATYDSPQVRVDITEYNKLAPLHNPYNLQGIIEANNIFPEAKHIICFDTAFFQTLPEIVRRYPLPERLFTQYRIKKYGFHGLSHEYAMWETAQLLKKKPSQLNLISIHLGEGASMCAIQKGKAIDISMGFTPTGGLMMTTRCGDIDPEIPIYLQKEGCSATEVEDIILRESGLLGVAQKTFVKDVFESYGKDER